MSDKQLFKLVKAGDLDGLLEAIGSDDWDDEEAHQDAYKWLQIAADFGLKRARAEADELLEATSGFDDGSLVVALIHLELGQAYLKGEAPLPVDHVKAKHHLDVAKKAEVHKTTDVAKTFDGFRRKIRTDARAVFDAYFPPTTKAKSAVKPGTTSKKAPAKKARR